MTRIVLASQSPRRRQLLEWAELEFDILARETSEEYPEGLSLEEIPIHIARQKAMVVQGMDLFARYEKHTPILAADTIVVLDGKVIGKPALREDAIRMLSELAGKKHRVITGVVILGKDKEVSFSDSTEVEFYPLSKEDIEYYVDKYQPYDKAGAYAIQEWIGVTSICSVNGDFYNVMGLPVSRVIRALNENF